MDILIAPNSEDECEDHMILCLVHSKHSILEVVVGGEKTGKIYVTT